MVSLIVVGFYLVNNELLAGSVGAVFLCRPMRPPHTHTQTASLVRSAKRPLKRIQTKHRVTCGQPQIYVCEATLRQLRERYPVQVPPLHVHFVHALRHDRV